MGVTVKANISVVILRACLIFIMIWLDALLAFYGTLIMYKGTCMEGGTYIYDTLGKSSMSFTESISFILDFALFYNI